MRKLIIIGGLIIIIVITVFATNTTDRLSYFFDKESYFISNDDYDFEYYAINEPINANFTCQDTYSEFLFSTIEGASLNVVGCQLDSNGIYVQFNIRNESTFKGGTIVSLDTLDGTTEVSSHPDIYLLINDEVIQGKIVSNGPFETAQNYGLFFSCDLIDEQDTSLEMNIDFGGFIVNEFTRK